MMFNLFEAGFNAFSKSVQVAFMAFRWGKNGHWSVFSVLVSRGYGTLILVEIFGVELTYRVPYENSQNAG